jgi:hypothetical protein
MIGAISIAAAAIIAGGGVAADQVQISNPVILETQSAAVPPAQDVASGLSLLALVVYGIAGFGFAMRQGRHSS